MNYCAVVKNREREWRRDIDVCCREEESDFVDDPSGLSALTITILSTCSPPSTYNRGTPAPRPLRDVPGNTNTLPQEDDNTSE